MELHLKVIVLIAASLVFAAPGSAIVHYVNLNNGNAAPPYLTWNTAASNIQAAIDIATPGDEILVTNGVYDIGNVGARGANRVAITKPVTVRSVNGPSATMIVGSDSARCVYVTNGAIISGFTLTNGAASAGGGVYAETGGQVSDCVIVGNMAHYGGGISGGRADLCVVQYNTAYFGGGSSAAELVDCTLANNYSYGSTGGGGAHQSFAKRCVFFANAAFDDGVGNAYGGGAYDCDLLKCLVVTNEAGWPGSGGGTFVCRLTNCTVVANSAYTGGGIWGGPAVNCIIYDNYAVTPATMNVAGAGDSVFYSCILPSQAVLNNITNAPKFVDAAGWDFRLRADSPCIDRGTNFIVDPTKAVYDIVRPMDGNGDGVIAIDIGAYEFQGVRLESIVANGSVIRVCWSNAVAGMKVESTSSIRGPWAELPCSPVVESSGCCEVSKSSGSLFFRLRLP